MSEISSIRVAAVLCAASFAVASASASHAQVAEADQENEREIIVTALKRSQLLQEVPASIQAFGAEEIGKARISDITDLARNVSGMDISVADNPTVVINIRGNTTLRQGDAPVAMVIDGVQYFDTKQLSQALFDIERIEVLKGPQGAIYGRNAIAGDINIITRAPSDSFEGWASAEVGSHNFYQLRGSLNLPLIPGKLAARIAGTIDRSNPWLNNSTTHDRPYDDEQKAVRGTLRFLPSDRLELNLAGSYSERDNPQFRMAFTPVFLPPGTPLTYGDLPDPNRISDPAGLPGTSRTKLWDASLRGNLDLGTVMLSSVSAMTGMTIANRDLDLDLTALPILITANDGKQRTWSQELRMTSQSTGPLRWLIGGDFLATEKTLFAPVFLDMTPRIEVGRSASSDRNRAWSAFGQTGWRTGKLDLSLEVRYDRDRRESTDLVPYSPTFGQTVERTFSAFQPKATASYFFSGDIMAYATVGKGFRTGGFNATSRFGRQYDPETLWNYEAGAKTSFADGKVVLNVSVFHQEVRDRQLFLFDVASGEIGITNAARKAWVRGAEADLSLRPAKGLVIRMNGSLTDSKITRYVPVAGLPVSGDFTSNKLEQTPGWTYAASIEYGHRVSDATLSGSIEAQGNGGDYYWFIDNVSCCLT